MREKIEDGAYFTINRARQYGKTTTLNVLRKFLEVRPKSWLKTVSAFANGLGGSFYIGVDDDGHAIGFSNIKESSDQISRLIKERISPLPDFNLTAYRVEGDQEILVLQIPHGEIPHITILVMARPQRL